VKNFRVNSVFRFNWSNWWCN